MTKEDIIRMAREAGLIFNEERGTERAVEMHRGRVERFADIVAAAESEACAKVCEEHANNKNPPYKSYEDNYLDGWLDASNQCGRAIRARSKA